MKQDPEHHEPPDADNATVAEARLALATARKSERVGSIAMAHVQLASAFAKSGQHTDAVQEYGELLSYLQLAAANEQSGSRRGAGTPGAATPPSRTDAVDLSRLEALARLNQVESMLALGRLDDAQSGLTQVAPMCRGFRRKAFRRKLVHLQRLLDRASTSNHAGSGSGRGSRASQPTETPDQDTGSATTVAGRLAAADATLGGGDARAAAREALEIVSDCDDDDHCRAQARQILGMALDVLGKHDESLATMKLSFADYLTSGNPAQAANLAIPMAVRLEATDESREAIALIKRCLTEADHSLDDSVQARLQTILGRLLDQDGDPAGARRHFEAACDIAPDTQTLADAEHGHAVCLGDDDAADAEQSVEALALLDAARAGYAELGSLDLVAGCEHEAAALLGRLNSFPAAQSRYQKALVGYQALDSQQNDAAWLAQEVADCKQNLLAIESQDTSGPTLFRSGGHDMNHETS